jgi:hydrogenase-4 component F
VLALVGFPPFSVFASEPGLARAGLSNGSASVVWATAAALVILVVVAAALIGHTSAMLLGDAPDGPGTATAPLVLPRTSTAAMVGGLAAAATLGVTSGPLSALLTAAVHTLTGAP